MTYYRMKHNSYKAIMKRMKATFSLEELQRLRRLNEAKAKYEGNLILRARGVFERNWVW